MTRAFAISLACSLSQLLQFQDTLNEPKPVRSLFQQLSNSSGFGVTSCSIMKQFDNENGHRGVVLQCENADDLICMFNVIRSGDILKVESRRRIAASYLVHCEFAIRVTEVVSCDIENVELTIKGEACEASKMFRKGIIQTVNLKPNLKFILEHPFDKLDQKRLDDQLALPSHEHPEVAVLVAGAGHANLCFVSSSYTLWKRTIRQEIPHKRKGFLAIHEFAMERFVNKVVNEVRRSVQWKDVKHFVIAGNPWLRQRILGALRQGNIVDKEDLKKIILVQASGGHRRALDELMEDPTVMQKFNEVTNVKPHRAVYGLTHTVFVKDVASTVLVSDALLRRSSSKVRDDILEIMRGSKKEEARHM
ncbi:hypothetical protein L596_014181 [Steinernema carpocapsae]|uniref:eRF1 domain-containing protein n=1 Tax=Steinernema carpocapsae TaxID=34508 RepID=A0A4U5NB24_STECR|nr:hypothetical protein L596_014181 [Steinernema carpocapsae]